MKGCSSSFVASTPVTTSAPSSLPPRAPPRPGARQLLAGLEARRRQDGGEAQEASLMLVVVFFLLTLKEVPRQRQRVAQVAIAADEYVGRLLPRPRVRREEAVVIFTFFYLLLI